MMKGKDASGSKGYAFVTFRTKEIASRAIEELNNSELKVIYAHVWLMLVFLRIISALSY